MMFIHAILVLGGLGFLFGAILAFAAQKFHVEEDPRIGEVTALLPGANCGGCGFPGCAGLAKAIVVDEVEPNLCPVASTEAREKIARHLGRVAAACKPKVALVKCNGLPAEEFKKFEYLGIKDCAAAVLMLNGPWQCPHRCIGLGTCKAVCPFGAITMGANELPIIDAEKCTACGKCVVACPRMIITLVEKGKKVHVKCNSPEKGPDVRKVCKVGCIGCRLCEKACKDGAIIIENNLARINYEKCTECGACVLKCPQKTIIMEGGVPKVVAAPAAQPVVPPPAAAPTPAGRPQKPA